jgi:hypothetical protein
VPHTLEPAATGRATCRGCGEKIAARTLRLGEQVPNPFSDDGGETTHWYHPRCAAFRRPEALLAALETFDGDIDDRDMLTHEAHLGVMHHRLPRVSTAAPAPTGRATCRSCKALIEKDTWRIALVYYEDGRWVPSGFVHAGCASGYLESTALMPRLRHFSPALTATDLSALEAALA